jgi:hypothetical protein
VTDISRRWQVRSTPVSTYQPAPEKTPEQRMPPMAQGTVKMLRERGHIVTVRATRDGSLRYMLDNEPERDALRLSNRLRKLHGVG